MKSEIDTKDLIRLTNKIKKSKGQTIRKSVEQFAIKQSEITERRYLDASRKTPYKDGHKDYFGIDTGRLLNEISQVNIRENQISQSTDLIYANRIEHLFKLKGTLNGLIPNNANLFSKILVTIFINYFNNK